MVHPKKATDSEILDAFHSTGSCRKAADLLGMQSTSVHERLVKLGANKPKNIFTDEDVNRLREEYEVYRDAGKLEVLAESMGRTKQFICRQAKRLGLTDKNCSREFVSVWKYLPKKVAKPILDKLRFSGMSVVDFCKKHGYGVVLFSRRMSELFPAEWDAITELSRTGDMYVKGREFEFRVKKDLESAGYFALRATASYGPADLVAYQTGQIMLIQCKLSEFYQIKPWNDLIHISESIGAIPVFACKSKSGEIEYWVMKPKDGSRKSVLDERFHPLSHEVDGAA